MKKITIFIALVIFCLIFVRGQNSTDTQTKDEIISKLQNNISKLEKEVEYYKKTLNLLDSKISAQDKNVDFKINSVTGESSTGKVVIEGIIINNGATRYLQKNYTQVFDPQGNEYNTREIMLGSSSIRLSEFYKDIPVKFKVEFNNTIAGTPMFNALILKLLSGTIGNGLKQDNLSVTFRNLPIEWQ